MKTPSQSMRRTVLSGTRALVIDGDVRDAWCLAATLRRLGFRARMEEVLPHAGPNNRMTDFDWLFCDVTNESGVDTIRAVHCDRPMTRVVALVRGGRVKNLANAVSALEHGADDFLVKPIQTESVALIVLALRAVRSC